jgi:surface protein
VNKNELQQAIGEYVAQDCANKPDCTLGQMYGWPMNSWCVSNVQDMSYLFYYTSNFNENISSWDVSNATNMNGMFYYANSFNSDLSGWNVSSVSDMRYMFYGASSFNSDLSGWNVSSVGDMSHMFYGAKSFNQNLCAWSDAFPYNAASNIFFESNCTYTSSPLLERSAPFCAFMCKDYPFISDTFPSDAVDTGGTEIRLVGYNFVIGQVVNQSILYECQFGSIAQVNATLISNNELSCISPEVQLFIGSMVVELTVIIDGQISFNSVPFRFYGICSENLCQYGYCSFGGCLVSLFSVELSLSKTPRHFSNAQIVLSWLPWRKLH